MKLYGLMVVKNESDVIEDVLSFLKTLGIFDRIFFFDLGSEDETFQKAIKFSDILYQPQILREPYTEKLRYDLLLAHRNHYEPGDWVTILDADEFYFDHPLEFIRTAEAEAATCIKTYQAQFMFTDADLAAFSNENVHEPIFDRRKFYLINWSEIRFFKYLGEPVHFDSSKPCSKRFINRHYQYRTPDQIRTRIETRLRNKQQTKNVRGRQDWLQIYSNDWKDYVLDHKLFHQRNSSKFQFGIPDSARFKDYYSKDPFSAISPQIAMQFLHGEVHGNSAYATIQRTGEISFKDEYGQLVLQDMKKDIQKRAWKQTIAGLSVWIQYKTRKWYESCFRRISIRSAILTNFFWNVGNILKRLVLVKSFGVLRAVPNPVSLLDYSGVGATTLRWTSFKTSSIQIRMDSPEGEIIETGSRSGTKKTDEFVSEDMLFFLQDANTANGKGMNNTLSKIRMKTLKSDKIIL